MNIDKQLQYRPSKVDNKALLEVGTAEHVRTAGQEAFHTSPPSRMAIYRIRDTFETLGSVCNAPKFGCAKTFMNE